MFKFPKIDFNEVANITIAYLKLACHITLLYIGIMLAIPMVIIFLITIYFLTLPILLFIKLFWEVFVVLGVIIICFCVELNKQNK
jgi:uncharacterized membrane protein